MDHTMMHRSFGTSRGAALATSPIPAAKKTSTKPLKRDGDDDDDDDGGTLARTYRDVPH
jgi:hypothetical protein